MSEYKEIIEQFLNELKPEIVESQKSKGLTASGKSAELLRVVMLSDKIGQLVDGSGSFLFQERGRAPTKSAVAGSPTLQEVIYEWLQYKKYGLNYDSDEERVSLSYAISKKIHKRGTRTYVDKQTTGVISEVITQERVTTLSQVFAKKLGVKVASDIVQQLTAA